MEASESIAEILRYCSGLCAERQTERKSFAAKLLTRLKDPCVQKTIDAASASKGKKKLSWGIISQAVFNYVFKEADILKASSKLTEDTIKRKAKDISETFRAFIQSAEKRGPSLKSGDVFRHIYKIMSDEKTRGWFCNEYTNVLMKNFLSVESHVCELTAKVWHDLVYIYCNCILSPPPRGDTSLFAQTFNNLTQVAGNLSHIRGKDLFKFFSCVFKDVRNDRNETVIFYLINALNNFSMSIASDSRGQLCILGEDLFPLLLPLWTKSSAHVKDKLIDFFRLQVDIHHPFGVHQEENGAWSSNEKLWKKCLTKLYEAINGEFHQLAGKLQLSGSKAGLAQNSNFVELAVGTFHQIFYLTNKKNKSSDSLEAENGIESRRKRRKTESGWQSVIDGTSLVSCPTACVAWLQFLASFIGQYASSFPSSEYLRFLNCLHQAIINCKRADVLSFVLQALRSLADNTDSLKSEHLRNGKEIETCWRNIWFETMKAIHSRNVDEPGYMLLSAILKADLLVSLEDPYRAFFSSGTRVSRESLALLICLLQRFPIPEKLNGHMEIYSSFEKSSKHQGRKKIIELVLPDIEFINAQKDFSQLLSSRSSDSNTASAVVLLSMIQKNPSAFFKADVLKNNYTSVEESDSYARTMKKIGELYLQSSFNLADKHTKHEKEKRATTIHAAAVLPDICGYISNRIVELKDSIINLMRDEDFRKANNHLHSWLNICIKYATLFLDVYVLLLACFDSSVDELGAVVAECTKNLFSTATTKIKDLYRDGSMEEDARDITMSSLLSFLNQSVSLTDIPGCRPDKLTFVFPESFLEIIFEIVVGKLRQAHGQDSRFHFGAFGSSSSASTSLGDFDDVMDTSSGMVDAKGVAASLHSTSGFHTAVRDISISRAEFVRIEAFKFLFHSAFDECESAVMQIKGRSIKDLLLDFLDESFDTSKTMCFQMLKNLVFILTSGTAALPPADLEIVFECIRRYISEFRSHQDACLDVLQMLHKLLSFLKASNERDEDQLSQMRMIANRILSAFWKQRDDKYSPHVRLQLLECLVEMMQVDPAGTWSKIEESKQASSSEELSCSLEDCLVQLFSDKSHCVRMRAAYHVDIMFQFLQDSCKPRPTTQQLKAYEKVTEALTELIIIKDDVTEQEAEDAGANRAATLLYILKKVAYSSSVCEKKAISLLFHDYKERYLDLKLVGKVFREIAAEKGFKDPKLYLKDHLGFLCNDWMKRGFPIVEFPSSVVHLEASEFLWSFAREIVSYLMFYRDENTFEKIKETLGLQERWIDLVIENFDRIVVFSLPFFACQSKRNQIGAEETAKIQEMEAERKKAKLAYEFLENCLTKQVIDKLLLQRFDDIVIELLLRMFDPPSESSDASQFMRDTDSAPNPPHFTSYAIRGTLEYLANCHQSKSILQVLLLKKDSCQKILLALATNITDAKSEREKVRILCAYRLLVLLIVDELQGRLGPKWAYIIRDVICRCCHWLNWHFLNGRGDTFFLCVYQILRKLTEASITSFSRELGCHVFKIVNTFTKYAKHEDEKGRKALQFLRFIVLDNSELLKDALVNLPPFPDTLKFELLSKRLECLKEEHCTRNIFEDFKTLYEQGLISNEAVKNLLQVLEKDRNLVQRFIETNKDGSKTVLAVVSCLLELALTSEQSEEDETSRSIRIGIAQCIGEIGPVDFHALALPSSKGSVTAEDQEYFGSNKSAYRYHIVFERLNSLLTDESTEVVAAAAVALKYALHTNSGIQHLNVFDLGKGEKPKFFLYCEPFKPMKIKKGSQNSQLQSAPTANNLIAHVGEPDLWEPDLMPFNDWVKELAFRLATSGAVEDDIFQTVAPVCKLNANFAELLLPFLFHNILANCSNEIKSTVSSLFNRFLSTYLSKRNSPNPCDSQGPNSQKVSNIDEKAKAARLLIDVVNYLRDQDKPSPNARQVNTKWDNNFWLDIRYLDLAQVASECCSHFAAVMYTEIWCDIQRSNSKDVLNSDPISSSQCTQLEEMTDMSSGSEEKASCQRLLFEAYRNIGEPDAMHGVGTGYSTDIDARIKGYEFEEEFGKALLTQDLQVDADISCSPLALAQNLEKAGLHHVLLTYMRGLDKTFVQDAAAYEALQLEACWRNGVWDIETQSSSPNQDKTTFSSNLYGSIVALKDGDQFGFKSFIDDARLTLLGSDETGGNATTSRLYEFLSKMHAVTQLETYGRQYFSKDLFGARTTALPNDFRHYELSLSLKAAAFKATLARETAKNEQPNAMIEEIAREAYSHFMSSAMLAREASRYQVCERYLNDVSQLEQFVSIPPEWKIEQAKMFWDRGEKNRAMYHLRSLIKICEKGKDPSMAELYPAALGIYGHWLAESRSENPGIIIEDYMEHAACLLEDSQCTHSENPSEAYYLLAKYADTQYKAIKEYIQSSAFENKQTVIKNVKDEVKRLDAMGGSAQVTINNRYYRSLVVQCEEDEKELQQMLNDRKQFLQKALENYVRCMCRGDKYDLRIFRLCSLWLENSHEESVNKVIKNCISTMESRKFIPLMYQLAARLGSTKSKESHLFNANLEKLLEKAAKDHPYQVTIIIMALCNVENEPAETVASCRRGKLGRKTAGEKNSFAEKGRVHSARALLQRLKASNPELIDTMEAVTNAYMELANHDIQHLKRQTGKFDLPSKLLIRRIRDAKHFAIPTLDIQVDPSCKYDNIIYISSFDNTFTHCGGINLPKVITCVGSDGKRRRQLVKGKDDLRQDAVMQQVFGMVNQLLKENAETRKRQLRIRTYKVVPLSQRSGIVEWCENTFPLGEYLIGNRMTGGAHARYHPNDWSAGECRKKFTDAANSNGKKSRYDTLQNIMSNFQPVFRHFFYEKFTDPVEWFTRRLAYTRSLASSSIVGYVLGLGDRHVQNILIDFITAELVHIDLGIAFEQGKQLPTPETIPFRLTRDLVDGMGIAGVEGVFRRCCEKVMGLMRSSQEAILTIVEVLLYDPLYAWTLSPLKAVQIQQKTTEDAGETLQNISTLGDDNLDTLLGELQSMQPQQDQSKNKMAQRVLIRLQQKLDGNEGGCFLSTEGQVNFLMQSARDTKNLCRLFPGWQPWL